MRVEWLYSMLWMLYKSIVKRYVPLADDVRGSGGGT